MSFVNITRVIPLYSYTPVSEPWFVHINSKSCRDECSSQPHCTGFSQATFGSHCHLFYIPFCAVNFETSLGRVDLIEAKSDSDPPEWKAEQKIATIPSAMPEEPGKVRERIDLAKNLLDSGVPWQHHDLSCLDICSQSLELLGFKCSAALLERDEQNSHPISCSLYDEDDIPQLLKSASNADVYLNTEVVQAKGCERTEEADRQAAELMNRLSPLDKIPLTAPSASSSYRIPKMFTVISAMFLAVLIQLT
jgi:hypothetical protein